MCICGGLVGVEGKVVLLEFWCVYIFGVKLFRVEESLVG